MEIMALGDFFHSDLWSIFSKIPFYLYLLFTASCRVFAPNIAKLQASREATVLGREICKAWGITVGAATVCRLHIDTRLFSKERNSSLEKDTHLKHQVANTC